MFPAPASGQPCPHAAAPRPSFPSHIWKVSRPHPGSAGAGFGTGLYAAPFRQRPGICRCKARPSHTQCFLRLHPGSLAPMRQRPSLRFPIPHLENFPPHIRDLPVWASARAFMRPRFAGVRASADVRPALPILNVSCACIRAALPPCGSAPALDFPFHIWKVSRPTSGQPWRAPYPWIGMASSA